MTPVTALNSFGFFIPVGNVTPVTDDSPVVDKEASPCLRHGIGASRRCDGDKDAPARVEEPCHLDRASANQCRAAYKALLANVLSHKPFSVPDPRMPAGWRVVRRVFEDRSGTE